MWLKHALNMVTMCLVTLVTFHLSYTPQALHSSNKLEEQTKNDTVIDIMTTGTNQLNINLPGGGFVFRAKMGVEISPSHEVEKLILENTDSTIEIKHRLINTGVEIVNINCGRGEQTPQHFPLIITWGIKDFRGSEDILIIPGEIETESGKKIVILTAEVKEGKDREDVLETLCQRGITKWLEVCDLVILQDSSNLIRKLLRDLSRATEGMVTLVTGPSVKDIENSPSMLVLARTVAEQFNLVSFNMCSNLFMLAEYDVMKIISAIDQDCCLIITVLTMCSYKWSMFTNCEWRFLGTCANYPVYWPVLTCHRP